MTRDQLREGAADDENIASNIVDTKGWETDDAPRADLIKWVRDGLQRQQ